MHSACEASSCRAWHLSGGREQLRCLPPLLTARQLQFCALNAIAVGCKVAISGFIKTVGSEHMVCLAPKAALCQEMAVVAARMLQLEPGNLEGKRAAATAVDNTCGPILWEPQPGPCSWQSPRNGSGWTARPLMPPLCLSWPCYLLRAWMPA